MWKAPKRPDNRITQSFNDGIVTIYTVSDAARPGYQPVEELTEKIRLRYEERRLGLKRYYEAAQNQIRVQRVIRVPHAGGVTSQDVAIDEKGRRYRVDLVQMVPDVYPLSDDVTLADFVQRDG